MTITTSATVHATLGSATFTLRSPAALADDVRSQMLEQLGRIADGYLTMELTGHTSLALGDTAPLMTMWGTLLVDVDGVDGFDDPQFDRLGIEPLARLQAIAGGRGSTHIQAASLLALFVQRSTANLLRSVLLGTHREPEIAALPFVGEFVGFGTSGISRGGTDWAIDEKTGCITHELGSEPA